MDKIQLQVPLKPGFEEEACYENLEVSHFRGNPLIEALPPIMRIEGFYGHVGFFPPYDSSERDLPDHVRLYAMESLRRLFVPLPDHWDLHLGVSRLLHMSYADRNPTRPGFAAQVNDRVAALEARLSVGDAGSSPKSFALLGPSGIGKTSTIGRLLLLYPPVIKHTTYNGQPLPMYQVVWLRLECPENGSLRDLTTAFFEQVDRLLGTNYYQNYCTGRQSAMQMLSYMARIVYLHSIGVLVIDEIQKLSKARSQGAQNILDFFIRLTNTIGTAVILIGTDEAEPLLSNRFSFVRRSGGQGEFNWRPMQKDAVWRMFLEALWEYQYVRNRFELTEDFVDAIHEVTSGIADLAVKVFVSAQTRAVNSKQEVVTPKLIRIVAQQQFPRALGALEQAKEQRDKRQRFQHSSRSLPQPDGAGQDQFPEPSKDQFQTQSPRHKTNAKKARSTSNGNQQKQQGVPDPGLEQAQLNSDLNEIIGASE